MRKDETTLRQPEDTLDMGIVSELKATPTFQMTGDYQQTSQRTARTCAAHATLNCTRERCLAPRASAPVVRTECTLSEFFNAELVGTSCCEREAGDGTHLRSPSDTTTRPTAHELLLDANVTRNAREAMSADLRRCVLARAGGNLSERF